MKKRHPTKIEEQKCTKCGSNNLIHQPLAIIKELNIVIPIPDIESPAGNTYYYRCGDCGKLLYSTEKL